MGNSSINVFSLHLSVIIGGGGRGEGVPPAPPLATAPHTNRKFIFQTENKWVYGACDSIGCSQFPIGRSSYIRESRRKVFNWTEIKQAASFPTPDD